MADAIVAASTGPLHIAAAIGKVAIGIYPPIWPMHPGRWAPLGPNVHVLVKNSDCNDCRKSRQCRCINEVSPESVKSLLDEVYLVFLAEYILLPRQVEDTTTIIAKGTSG